MPKNQQESKKKHVTPKKTTKKVEKHVNHKEVEKKVSEVKKDSKKSELEAVEEKLDEQINKIVENKSVKKILDNKIVSDVINSKVLDEVNTKIEKKLNLIFDVIWWICVVFWSIWLLASISLFFGPLRLWAVWWFFRSTLYLLIMILLTWLSIISWIWFLKRKKRVPLLTLLNVIVGVVYLVISFIPVTYVFWKAVRSWIWSSILSILVSIIIFVLVAKNKKLFKN